MTGPTILPPALLELQGQGRLSQDCPRCGITEAAGAYCTTCYAPTGQACWRRGEMGEAQRVALARHRASPKQEGANPAILDDGTRAAMTA